MISLELLLSIINQAGSTFLSNERFLVAIRSYLCVSLLQNCTSIYTQVVELSLRVFVVLITHFKAHLKGEMEVFITNIFLRILDSENSTFEHKMLVLEVLNHICDDQLILSEIFLNYDCDWDSMDLFKRIVNALAKIAKSKHHTGTPTARQLKLQQNEAALVLKGLECLTSTVHSLKKAANFVSIRSQTKTTTENDSDNEDESVSPRLPSSTVLVVEVFDKKKKRQDLLSTGIVKFNVKATDGVKFCTSNNLIENTPRAVAQFLHQYNNKLDKFQIGEYLGRESAYQNGFCVKVLHEFVDMMDFHELELDEAIRSYLSYFRLPGEAQKIDRMMEKFAERYHLNNPGVFPSADVAFILSFSVIMLQTDLHNPSIPEEKKMTKEGFLRNNRGINNGEDLPPEYLGGIYDRIKSTPISLKEEQTMKLKRESSTFTVSAAVLDKQRKEAFGREREAMVKSSEAFFKRKSPSNRKNVDKTKSPLSFHVVSNTAENVHVKPMFEIVWAPLLAVCSVIFETSDHPVAVQYCLDGFKHAIHLSARLQMHSERDAYVSVLANFTAVQHSATRAIATKQIEAIKTLIAIAVKEGNFLGDAWRDVLQCISHLARLQLHAQGLHSDTQFFVSPANSRASIASNGSSKRMGSLGMLISNPFNPNSFPSPKFKPQALPDDQLAANEALNAQQILDQIDGLAIDRVFSNSALLSDNSVQEFVQQLCIVSLTECQGLSGVGVTVRLTSLSLPRVFSLQKLVEVADMNMHVRSRVVWASIWSVLSRHFTTIGCHDNLSLAMYAIDSLKQLSMKFLEKDELRDFNFQRLFLAPFEIIMGNAVSMEIRELVLSCVHNMILSRVDNIKSGWKTIWGVLRVAAETFDPTEKADRVVLMGFMLAKTIVDTHFDRVVTVFLDLIECVLAFALCGSTEESSSRSLVEMSLDATNVLGLCLGYVASGRVIEQIEAHAAAAIMSPRNRAVNTLPPDQLHYTDQESHTHIWRPVLHALATLASDPLIEVRETAIDTLYGSLHMHGSTIDASLWHMIFRDILVPLMESIRKVELQEKISFNRKTSKKALLALVHLYGTFYPSIGHVDEILELLKRWMVREAEDELACAAALSYEHLLIQHGHQFEPEIWELITSEIEAIQRNLLPLWLVEDHKEHSNPGMYPAVSKLLFTKHVELEKVPSLTHMTVLLETQRICSNVLVQVHSSLPSSCFDAVLTCLKESFDFARRLNDDYKIRLLLFQKGWRYGSQSAKELPHMLAQEIMGKREYLKVVCHHLADFRGDFTELVQTCLKEYLLWSQEGDAFSLSMDQRQRSYGYVPLIVDILEAISKFPEDEVLRHLAWLYPLLTELIQTNSIEVRRALFLVFNSSIQMLLLLLLPHKS
ncbi:Brefeldin A-inhibited guanine nucleotide-exchange protein 1 [Aphanomyces cochlioides]|nr:Brefeldin A-inhibited guanine nucleotide-exchange protein 1 [Aphanomyces cochlioides]